MKTKWLFLAMLLPGTSIFAQNAATGGMSMGLDFNIIASQAHKNITTAALPQYHSPDISGQQYFFGDWREGSLVTKKQEVFDEGLLFVYDKVEQQLYVKKENGEPTLIANKDEIASFSLKDNNSLYHFINSSLISDRKPEVFYQVMVYDSARLSLFKYYNTSFTRADYSDLIKVQMGMANDQWVDKITYYLVNADGTQKSFQLKLKSIREACLELGANPSVFLDANNDKPMDEDYLVRLVRFLNDTPLPKK